MRAFLIFAVLVSWIAGLAQAGAADLGVGDRGAHYAGAERAGALIIYDYEPGIVQRAYWLPPWRDRHYFPFRAEKVREVPAGRPKPAESYFRYWSNDGAMLYAPPPEALHTYGSAQRRPARARVEAAPAKNNAPDDNSAATLFE